MPGNARESNLFSQNQQAVSALLSYIAQSKSKRVVAPLCAHGKRIGRHTVAPAKTIGRKKKTIGRKMWLRHNVRADSYISKRRWRLDDAGRRGQAACSMIERSLQKPLLIAKYGMRATSARPGAGSLRLKTASALHFRKELRQLVKLVSPLRIPSNAAGISVVVRTHSTPQTENRFCVALSQ